GDAPTPLFANATTGPITANRTYNIFNKNGSGRSLHFLAAWCLLVPGGVYLVIGIFGGHFRAHVWPSAGDLSPRLIWRDFTAHLRLTIPPATGGPQYGLLQKWTYSGVVFVAAPLMALTGLTMSPAATARLPWPFRLFSGVP